jgi:hypothetical protein
MKIGTAIVVYLYSQVATSIVSYSCEDEVCDATEDAKSTTAGNQKNKKIWQKIKK